MFQLIVAVISIALIAALAIASIFYGGDAFTKSSEKATVTTLINQAQQIAGAAALYKTDYGVPASAISDLDGTATADAIQYLSAVPTGSKVTDTGWSIDAGHVIIPFKTDADVVSICKEVGKQAVGKCYTGTIYGTHVEDNTAVGFALSL